METPIREHFTRVTDVLSPYNNFDNILPHVLKNASERGEKVHLYCQLYAEGRYFPTPDEEIKNFVDSYTRWYDEMVEEAVLIEWRGYNDHLRITGRMDVVARLRGDKAPTVIDIKAVSVKSKSWNLQLAAYKYLFNQDKDKDSQAERRIALQLSKDGKKPKVVEFNDHDRDWSLYKNALSLWRYYE